MKREYVPPPPRVNKNGKKAWPKHTPKKTDLKPSSNILDLSSINLNDIIEKKPVNKLIPALTKELIEDKLIDLRVGPPPEITIRRYYNPHKPGWIRRGDSSKEIPIENLSESAAHLLKYLCDSEQPDGAVALFSMGPGTIYLQKTDDTINQ
jgi:hypothetical protein